MRATDLDLADHRTRERLKAHEAEGSDLSPSDGAEIAIEELERLMRDDAKGRRTYYGKQYHALGGRDDDD